jgi:small subunit ribosomal protein S17
MSDSTEDQTSPPPPPAPAAADVAARPNARKVREGIVASASMDKTAVVVVTERVRHPRYFKTVQRTKRLYIHDENNDVRVGDRVRVQETRPLSKLKRWRLLEVVERAR